VVSYDWPRGARLRSRPTAHRVTIDGTGQFGIALKTRSSRRTDRRRAHRRPVAEVRRGRRDDARGRAELERVPSADAVAAVVQHGLSPSRSHSERESSTGNIGSPARFLRKSVAQPDPEVRTIESGPRCATKRRCLLRCAPLRTPPPSQSM
jgi:hypothetical protein